MSANNINPSEVFGGTWEPWGNGRVPVGVDTSQTQFSTAEKTGGENTHTLTVNEMPAHKHSNGKSDYYIVDQATLASSSVWGIKFDNVTGYYAQNNLMQNTGSSAAHNNLQPYITCYMWKRTA